jgi:hypothetical protein
MESSKSISGRRCRENEGPLGPAELICRSELRRLKEIERVKIKKGRNDLLIVLTRLVLQLKVAYENDLWHSPPLNDSLLHKATLVRNSDCLHPVSHFAYGLEVRDPTE